MAEHNEAEVIYRLGQLRQRYAIQFGRLTYKGFVHPDRRTVAQQNYDHIVKVHLFHTIRDLDDLFGIREDFFSSTPPHLDYPPISRYKRRKYGN